jgi:hypothetical protein
MRQTVKIIHPNNSVGLEYILNDYISIGWSVVNITPFTGEDGLMSYIVVFQNTEE